MKRVVGIIIVIFIVALAGFVFLYRTLKPGSGDLPVINLTPSPVPSKEDTRVPFVTYNNAQFAYAYFIVQNPSTLTLIPNFTRPKDAESIMSENKCTSAVNGGFYDKQNKPLGFFQSDEKVIGQELESDLVNGYVWSNASGSAVISTELPHADFHFALQTGPILIFDGKTLPLVIHNDTGARRMVAAKDDKLVYLAIYKEDSVFEGPNLTDLPSIVEAISNKEHLNIMDATNLDGGSASAFYNGETRLSEISPVGSLFCVKY